MEIATIKRLALVLAVHAEIEGMKASNAYNEMVQQPPRFNITSFEDKALELRNLAHAHDDQL